MIGAFGRNGLSVVTAGVSVSGVFVASGVAAFLPVPGFDRRPAARRKFADRAFAFAAFWVGACLRGRFLVRWEPGSGGSGVQRL